MKPLFEAFRAAMMNRASGSRKEAMDEFVATMKSDPEYLDALAVDYFERMAAVWVVRSEGVASNSFGRTDASHDKIERLRAPRSDRPARPAELVRRTQEENAIRAMSALSQFRAMIKEMVLLDMVLPNGKVLRDATGAECAKAGGFFSEVARHIKPTQVVDRHLTEGDLQNIKARIYQKNSTKEKQS